MIRRSFFDTGHHTDRIQVWSYGGGTQSVAIAALIIQGVLPKPDYAVIADTGMEKQSTWDYMDRVTNPELASIGIEIVRIKRSEWETGWSKGEAGGCFAAKGDMMIPVFTTESGVLGKLSGFCSSAWKKEVVNRWLSKTHGVTVSKTRKWLGFSTDEPRRFVKHLDSEDIYLPLVVGSAHSREQCVNLVKSMGWPTPPRSNCWMCPNQHNDEWIETKQNRPDEFEKAVLLERKVREIDPNAWFHWQCVPLDHVDWTISKPAKTRACDSGECFL